MTEEPNTQAHSIVLFFAYDFTGRRIKKTAARQDASLQVTTLYLYDGWNVVAELNVNASTSTFEL